MDKQWLKTYYKGLGWTEQRITKFLREAELSEKIKAKDVKRLAFEVKIKEKGEEK